MLQLPHGLCRAWQVSLLAGGWVFEGRCQDAYFGFLEHPSRTRFPVPKITSSVTFRWPAGLKTSHFPTGSVPKDLDFAPHGVSSKIRSIVASKEPGVTSHQSPAPAFVCHLRKTKLPCFCEDDKFLPRRQVVCALGYRERIRRARRAGVAQPALYFAHFRIGASRPLGET
jgi:hypothetical protein